MSSELIFATYQNAGVRVFDIRDQLRPTEVGAFVPPAPARMMDHRPNRARVIQSADVFVDANGLIYSTDYNAGLFILEYERRIGARFTRPNNHALILATSASDTSKLA